MLQFMGSYRVGHDLLTEHTDTQTLNFWILFIIRFIFSISSFFFRCPFIFPCNSVEGSGTPLQYSCLGNPMDGGAW